MKLNSHFLVVATLLFSAVPAESKSKDLEKNKEGYKLKFTSALFLSSIAGVGAQIHAPPNLPISPLRLSVPKVIDHVLPIGSVNSLKKASEKNSLRSLVSDSLKNSRGWTQRQEAQVLEIDEAIPGLEPATDDGASSIKDKDVASDQASAENLDHSTKDSMKRRRPLTSTNAQNPGVINFDPKNTLDLLENLPDRKWPELLHQLGEGDVKNAHDLENQKLKLKEKFKSHCLGRVAKRGWDDFVKACEVMGGMIQKSAEIQMEGAQHAAKDIAPIIQGVAEGTPGLGHVMGIFDYAMGWTDAGNRAMESATRTTAVFAAGAGGFVVAGPGGAFFAGANAGMAYDGIATGIDSAVHNQYRPHNIFFENRDLTLCKLSSRRNFIPKNHRF